MFATSSFFNHIFISKRMTKLIRIFYCPFVLIIAFDMEANIVLIFAMAILRRTIQNEKKNAWFYTALRLTLLHLWRDRKQLNVILFVLGRVLCIDKTIYERKCEHKTTQFNTYTDRYRHTDTRISHHSLNKHCTSCRARCYTFLFTPLVCTHILVCSSWGVIVIVVGFRLILFHAEYFHSFGLCLTLFTHFQTHVYMHNVCWWMFLSIFFPDFKVFLWHVQIFGMFF